MISNIKKDIALKTMTANAWVDTKPWINETEREEVIAALEGLLKIVSDKEAEQAKKLDHETPAFLVQELAAPVDKVTRAYAGSKIVVMKGMHGPFD